jgi:hypothetical protein
MIEYGRRVENIGKVRSSLRLMARNDLDVYRRSADMALRDGVISLTLASRYVPCTPKEAQALVDARTYIASTPDPLKASDADFYRDGLAYCDKPETPRPTILF